MLFPSHLLFVLYFPLEEKYLPSNSVKILWSNKFMKVPPCKIFLFLKIKMTFASYENLGFKSRLHNLSILVL
jgi:hypothetical protein